MDSDTREKLDKIINMQDLLNCRLKYITDTLEKIVKESEVK